MVKWIAALALTLFGVGPAAAWTHGVGGNLFTVACAGSDDSAAINAAIDKAIAAYVAGSRGGVYFPAGICAYKTPHATMLYPVSLYGDGHMQSIIKVDPTLNGDVFSWSDVWYNSSILNNPPNLATSRAGVHVEGISVEGDVTSAFQQNAFMFYDRTDDLLIDDVECYWVPGRCMAFGYELNRTQAYMRESRIMNTWVYQCGLTAGNVPSVEFHDDGNADDTDMVQVHAMNVFASHGPGLAIRSNDTGGGNLSGIQFYGLRVEGKQNSPAGYSGDLIQIGDGSMAGAVSGIDFYGVILISPYTGYSAFKLVANGSTLGLRQYEINARGMYIGPGLGNGIDIEAGRNLHFQVLDMSISGTPLTVGPASQGISGPITLDANNAGINWLMDIDATSSGFLYKTPWTAFP